MNAPIVLKTGTIVPKKETPTTLLCRCGTQPIYYSHGKWSCAACWAATQGRAA